MNEAKSPHFGLFFGYGMRPFFLFAGIFAVLAMLGWVGSMASNGAVAPPMTALPAYLWHGHEMLFGYAGAVIAGFLLTAVPSWTGTPILGRRRLMSLVALWLAGRLAVSFGAALPGIAVAIIDIAFPLVLAAMVTGPLWRRRALRNYMFVGVLAVFATANGLVHAEMLGWLEDSARAGLILGIDTVVLLMVVVGGRIVPAFTTGALRQNGVALRKTPLLDRAAILSVLIVLLADLIVPDSAIAGYAALFAAAAQAARMSGWRGWKIRHMPILWVLHLGYGWIAVGLALKGAADAFGWVSPAAGLHGLTIGAVGTLTLGVMSRAALGHAGRALVAGRALTTAYIAVSLAALLRVFAPGWMPEWYGAAMIASGLIWVAAFVIFTAYFWPILTRPRLDGRPG